MSQRSSGRSRALPRPSGVSSPGPRGGCPLVLDLAVDRGFVARRGAEDGHGPHDSRVHREAGREERAHDSAGDRQPAGRDVEEADAGVLRRRPGRRAVVFFFAALVLWGSAKAMGAEARYTQLLAIWGHADLPNVVGALLAIPHLSAASRRVADAGRRRRGREVERGSVPGSVERPRRSSRSPARSTSSRSPSLVPSRRSGSAGCRASRRAPRRRRRSSSGSST